LGHPYNNCAKMVKDTTKNYATCRLRGELGEHKNLYKVGGRGGGREIKFSFLSRGGGLRLLGLNRRYHITTFIRISE